MHTQQNNQAGLLPRLQIKPHTGPLLSQLLQDGGLIVGQTARKNFLSVKGKLLEQLLTSGLRPEGRPELERLQPRRD